MEINGDAPAVAAIGGFYRRRENAGERERERERVQSFDVVLRCRRLHI